VLQEIQPLPLKQEAAVLQQLQPLPFYQEAAVVLQQLQPVVIFLLLIIIAEDLKLQQKMI
jgi:hypothetical protein